MTKYMTNTTIIKQASTTEVNLHRAITESYTDKKKCIQYVRNKTIIEP